MVSNHKIRAAILKATDAKLRSDNWQYIIDVCDLVKEDPEDGGEYAMEVIEERLSQQDANVVLRTLSLVVSLAENCGSRLKQLISSKHFTGVLFSLVESRTVHATVKSEIAKVVKQLADSFRDDPSLKAMQDLHKKVRSKAPHLSQQPNIPKKKEMSNDAKLKEEKELEEALKLSLAEYQQQKQPAASVNASNSTSAVPVQQNQQTSYGVPASFVPTSEPAPAQTVIKRVRAMYDLTATESDELSFKKGDVITVVEQVYRDWWRGNIRGKVGIFPLNYVTPITEPTKEELEREKQQEDLIFGQKDKVDRLQQTLKTPGIDSDITQEQQVNDLYSSVTPLRPQITKMIGKYAQKKEDLTSLRQILANAEMTYNQLLDGAANAYTSPVPSQVQPHFPQQVSPQFGQQVPPQFSQQVPPQLGRQASPQSGQQIPPQFQSQLSGQNHSLGGPNPSQRLQQQQHPQQQQQTYQRTSYENGYQAPLSTNQPQQSQQAYTNGQYQQNGYNVPYPMSTQNTGI